VDVGHNNELHEHQRMHDKHKSYRNGDRDWEVENAQPCYGGCEYEVHKIIDSKTLNGHDFYLVHWKGYGTNDQTWEPYCNLVNAPKKVQKFLQLQQRKNDCC
jgi:NAD-dependent dihydropyrimidine dehydrogenase PreA subunit